jgi:coenzyme F420-dependent glucose-6-phosphate dehydrogenase
MVELGYALSSEEHRPLELVENARRAEEAGFPYAFVSDHFHPWTDRQGQSPFVWSVLGAIARETESLRVGTGVTCPTIRVHPAIIAQAAATTAALMPGRFLLGVGSGENLNEHILGERWPSADVRLEMLTEAVGVIRQLWQGGQQSHRGAYYTVEDARLYTLPEVLPAIAVAAAGPEAAEVAARCGDALISTSPDSDVVDAYRQAGGRGVCYGQMTVCYAASEKEAAQIALKWWPNAGLAGPLSQELPLPAHFEAATAALDESDVAEKVACGPNPDKHLEAIELFADAGFDSVYVHQVGPDQAGFFQFYQSEIIPKLGALAASTR